jgi:hypothetical protein
LFSWNYSGVEKQLFLNLTKPKTWQHLQKSFKNSPEGATESFCVGAPKLEKRDASKKFVGAWKRLQKLGQQS